MDRREAAEWFRVLKGGKPAAYQRSLFTEGTEAESDDQAEGDLPAEEEHGGE